MTDSSRRRFLHVITTGTASAAFFACSSKSGSPESFGDVQAGSVTDTPVGTLRAVDGAPVAIGRDQHGLYAMTTTCTHEGCDMVSQGNVSSGGMVCNCHGSRFDANGAVLEGPASSPLQHFAVEVSSAGEITIHGGTEVDASVRAAVPTS